MLPPFFIRSSLFNLCFYTLTGLSCILLLPTLFLPRDAFLWVVHGFVHATALLEKYILGLTYEIRGKENLPKEGPYLIAAKHQSAYETYKLHILFDDPAIVLKKELLKIPLWGKYLGKSDVIAIDRSSPKAAIKSIQEEAKRVAAQKRPMLIFPQGTRVGIETSTQEKPYKIGIVRMQEATNLPIIPLALNSGIFYPKHKWCKKPGRVVFEFLPPILPQDTASETLKAIEEKLEQKSLQLIEEGKKDIPQRKSRPLTYILLTSFLLFCAYSLYWTMAAELAKTSIAHFYEDVKKSPLLSKSELKLPRISGFPGKMILTFPPQFIETRHEIIEINAITAKGWPIPSMPIDIKTSVISLGARHWLKPLHFDSLEAQILYKPDLLLINHANLLKGNMAGRMNGTIDFSEKNYPALDLTIRLENILPFTKELVQKNIIKKRPAMFAQATLMALEKDGTVTTTLSSDQNKLYLGPIKVFELPQR